MQDATHILVAEDEPSAGQYLVKGLVESGFVVDLAQDGNKALRRAIEQDYALLILDVGLPGIDGWEVLRQLRQQKPTPVLFLTARDHVEDRVHGLELGADDYLIKPFAFSELLARVRALLRREKTSTRDKLVIADLEIDVLRRQVQRNGESVRLTVKEFSLLELFMRRQGEVLSRTLIAQQVWDVNFDSDTNVVDVAVRRLRTKIDEPYKVKLIHTVRGFGYILEERA